MSNRNLISSILIGLLSCLALALITLIVLDSWETKPLEHPSASVALKDSESPILPSVESQTGKNTLPDLANPPSEPHKAEINPVNSAPKAHKRPADPQPSAGSYAQLSALLAQNQDEKAIEILQRIIRDNPEEVKAYSLLGDLHYQHDRLKQAISAWEKVLEIDPFNETVRARLAKAQREYQAHRGFIHEATRHFRIEFEGSENRDLYKTILEILEEAFNEVGKALSFYPDREITVFLYTEQQFFDVTRAPAWTGGIFDGRIRIPAKGYQNHLDQLRRILFHEYAHAVIHQMTGQHIQGVEQDRKTSVPTWLHEGIAQYLEPRTSHDEPNAAFKVLAERGALLELSRLHGSFLGFNNQLAGLAYEESLSAVTFLVDQYGLYSLQRILTALAQQKTVDEAMRDILFLSYEEFQSRWEEHLRF